MSTPTLLACCCASLALVAALARPADRTPRPAATPTPRPDTLAAYARDVTLRRPTDADPGAPLQITTADLEKLGAEGYLTVGGASGAAPTLPPPVATPTGAVRERWRRRYTTASAAVHRLERRRESLLADLDQLGSFRPTPRLLVRIDRLEASIAQLDDELSRAREALAEVVRAARKEGAEPGWFRGL